MVTGVKGECMTTRKPKLPNKKVRMAFAMFLSQYEKKWNLSNPHDTLDDFIFWLEEKS
jgi:hypothetical protein